MHGRGWCICACSVAQSCLTLCNPVVPLSMGFSREEYWSGLPFPSPEDLPDSGVKAKSPASPTLAGEFFTWEGTWEALVDGV